MLEYIDYQIYYFCVLLLFILYPNMQKFSHLVNAFLLVHTTIYINFSDSASSSMYSHQNCTCGLDLEFRDIMNTKIVGGVEAKIEEFPWQAALFYGSNFICGGTILNDKYILTAAHCFKSWDKEKKRLKPIKDVLHLKFLLGATVIDNLNQIYLKKKMPDIQSIEYIIIHPKYLARRLDYDISLVKLEFSIPEFSRKVLPICLPPLKYDFVNDTGVVAGWGSTVFAESYEKKLRKTSVKVLPHEECSEKLPNYYVRDRMICAALPGKDTCTGDSGGPLMVRFSNKQYCQVGITSVGFGCGDIENPGVYTRLNKFVPWIISKTKDAHYCQV